MWLTTSSQEILIFLDEGQKSANKSKYIPLYCQGRCLKQKLFVQLDCKKRCHTYFFSKWNIPAEIQNAVCFWAENHILEQYIFNICDWKTVAVLLQRELQYFCTDMTCEQYEMETQGTQSGSK